MHEHFIEGEHGDTVDAVPFCSDSCHRAWCADNDEPYGGWSGAHENDESLDYCAQCGVRVSVGTEYDDSAECDGSCLPVVVNLAYPRDRESFCEHGVPDSVAV